jgi:phosphopentomutase
VTSKTTLQGARSRSGRFTIIVLDGCGVGGAPDARAFGDAGSDTVGHVLRARAAEGRPLDLPNLDAWGLGAVLVQGSPAGLGAAGRRAVPLAAFGRMTESGRAKDTTAGHWEMMGLPLERPFPTYPHGFPSDLLRRISDAAGFELIGNEVASGTEIVERLGEEALRKRALIVYTSADSVLQLAAHEDAVRVEDLYEACRAARALLTGEHGVGRVIARPFEGLPGAFVRTSRRRDFSLAPTGPTVIDALASAGIRVHGIGKVGEVFTSRGFADSDHTPDNESTARALVRRLASSEEGLYFANLGDFDTLWGHRNDVAGFADGLEAFDRRLPEIEAAGRPGDVVAITADHGCDPTTPSTDHSREQVPLLVRGPGSRGGRALGVRSTFADLGATVAESFGVAWGGPGRSFWEELL